MSNGSSKTKVRVDSESYPEAHSEWQVNLVVPGIDPNPNAILLYNNLCYDLVAAVMAKLGIEYSKWIVDGAPGDLDEKAAEITAKILR